ncbi:hypothetical protein TraAM80_05388 [Trypanosoma rangeli]|uniref:Pyrroline-5-carboxylate reductase catalytic N-terminal domain-containing protein n=1 Tax=Trypanosoma rangeli TaxID=5698 RepID=A0A422NFK7_TRYRA|nr:uncharacterized protein TraAM80_05388 [Trypanosoma rangeli]RNF04252.1 hypothetical protein TraAM80_05388 [Trypanosoma rangeli]|eukprot:RNF04252.1 hypothetical protein TraAM80_05388 [Trypanosoma rangeli]
MQETTKHLLDGVVGLACVDPTLHPSTRAAPLVVSIITQQCLYLCHSASSCQALLNEGDSLFWHIMRRVAEARACYVALRTPPPPRPLRKRVGAWNEESLQLSAPPVRGSHCTSSRGSSSHSVEEKTFPSALHSVSLPLRRQLLSPLEFRVVVVGGGRVGRAIVERLLQASYLIHPSRITIITRQPETVVQFADRGVQCTGRTEGRQALMECHVLILACQQTQFYDFASIYCPRHTQKPVRPARKVGNDNPAGQENLCTKKRLRREKKRTLRDVVNKWRTIEDNDYADGIPGATMTRLLKPGTFVFSCCAALETHKIARELGHLDPLVVNTEVDMSAVHAAAQQFQNSKDNFRLAYIQRIQLEGNSFLTALNVLHQTYMNGGTPPADFTRDILHDPYSTGLRVRGGRPGLLQQPSINEALRGEGVSGSTSFLLRVWRALRCFVVARVASLKLAEHLLFMYLQRVGPLLGPIFVALPDSSQARVVEVLEEVLNRKAREDYDGDEALDVEARPLVKLDQRIAEACDSDSDSGDGKGEPPTAKELARLIACFPQVFGNEEVVLQQLREEYIAVTER